MKTIDVESLKKHGTINEDSESDGNFWSFTWSPAAV